MKFYTLHSDIIGEQRTFIASSKMHAIHTKCIEFFREMSFVVDSEVSQNNNFEVEHAGRRVRVVLDCGEPAILELNNYCLTFVDEDAGKSVISEVQAVLKDDSVW